ncbi:sugar phosphate isomerase/epimerase family protein [Paenibacillus sp. MBLB4367]|uniref:sugar phosphate isomerase/epimerase family protein n=1 Tax=Paenibacillus sp. MBLB4367 TaxID=3384767 RepID=UPI00390818F9
MELKVFKSLWGMEGTLEQQVKQVAAAGYHGIETGLPAPDQKEAFKALLAEHKLDYIAMLFTQGPDHADSFKRQLDASAEFRPVQITSHSAKDSMEFADQAAFFSKALELEREYGIPVGHETHRMRAMFTPWTTAKLLREFPDLKITADFSHWCCVCESLLGDQADNLALAFERTLHIHGRVGYAEGPQVPHPAAPEYAAELAAHEGWWSSILRLKAAKGVPLATFTPEFGPPGYMHTLPFTKQPVADLWDVCAWMAKRFEDEVFEQALAK